MRVRKSTNHIFLRAKIKMTIKKNTHAQCKKEKHKMIKTQD